MKDASNIYELVEQRISELPESVQQAIEDAEVEKKLRGLSAKYKLHLDQWVLLEHEIMLTLLDLQDPEDMVENVAKKVNIKKDLALQIVNDISIQVFRPIHEQLRGELDREALQRGVVDTSKKGSEQESDSEQAVQEQKDAPSDTTAYKRGQNSMERRDVQEDPYRESII